MKEIIYIIYVLVAIYIVVEIISVYINSTKNRKEIIKKYTKKFGKSK